MTETTPRQVLYALVSGGFLLVVLVLIIGSAVAGIVPGWWTAAMSATLAVAAVWSAFSWRRTGAVLIASIGLLAIWTAGTLVVS